MRTLVLLVAVAVSLAVGVSASAKPGRPGFPLGVAAGEVTPTSARLWARCALHERNVMTRRPSRTRVCVSAPPLPIA